jgi:hypothetical protein
MTSFITINAKAYTVFAKIAKQVEAKNLDWQLTLAAAGILPQDYRPFAIAYVAETSGTINPVTGVRENVVEPTMGQRGLTFTKDSKEDSRVKYLVAVLSGAAQEKAAARSLSKVSELDKALKAFAKLSAADKKAFMAKAK